MAPKIVIWDGSFGKGVVTPLTLLQAASDEIYQKERKEEGKSAMRGKHEIKTRCELQSRKGKYDKC